MTLKIRKPAVAGQFYSADPVVLKSDIANFLHQAQKKDILPKAIIVPHAGYGYSGIVAASAYVLLSSQKESIKRVVLLGPSHRVGFYGMALSSADFYETPLGKVKLDKEVLETLVDCEFVQILDQAHFAEHSLEVQIPFLQETLNDFVLTPLVVGEATAEEVGEVLLRLWGGKETLIVISSDLSHFESYEKAKLMDQKSCEVIESLDYNGLQRQDACGRYPVKGMLYAARKKGLSIQTLDLRNSGDVAGSKTQVVGYGAWALYEE